MKLQNKVVLITGSSSGIGEATARLFAKEGAKVVINCKTNITGAEKVVQSIRENHGEAIFIQADVSRPDEVKKLFEETVDKFGKLDILINNAGGGSRGKPFLETTYDDWVSVFNDNLFGTVLCSREAAKIMLQRKKGKILNTASIRGIEHTGREGIMAYSAAKAAVINLTKTLAKELAPYVNVNAVAPGFVYTPNYDKMSDEIKNNFIKNTAIGRWIKVEEIAEAFLYLAQAESVTGEVLVVDGGFTLKMGC